MHRIQKNIVLIISIAFLFIILQALIPLPVKAECNAMVYLKATELSLNLAEKSKISTSVGYAAQVRYINKANKELDKIKYIIDNECEDDPHTGLAIISQTQIYQAW